MKLKTIVVVGLQSLGLISVAGGVAMLSLAAGAITFGVGLLAFGIAAERTNA